MLVRCDFCWKNINFKAKHAVFICFKNQWNERLNYLNCSGNNCACCADNFFWLLSEIWILSLVHYCAVQWKGSQAFICSAHWTYINSRDLFMFCELESRILYIWPIRSQDWKVEKLLEPRQSPVCYWLPNLKDFIWEFHLNKRKWLCEMLHLFHL